MYPVEPDRTEVEIAEALLAEWDGGQGTSKSEIERRVWGDGGAHGRRFDRFIRQTLGVATTHPSRQSGRITDLERQLRQFGVAPHGSVLVDWEIQLQHGRQALLAALRCWNDPVASFRTETFALLFVTAWNSLAIAALQKEGGEWRELNSAGEPVLVEGVERAAATEVLVGRAFDDPRHLGLRRNVYFWTGLRNKVAHRHLPALDLVTIPQAQAGLLNIETAIEDRFGHDYTLGAGVSVPLQLSGFRDPGVLASLKKLQASLPVDVQAFLADQADRNESLVNDPTYMLRVTFVPTVPASGRNPDAVAYFVRPGEVTDDLGTALKEYAVVPKYTRAPRPNLIASQVVEIVSDRILWRFTMTMHTEATRRLKARPPREAEDQTACDPRYCEYVPAVKRHLYNQAWVDRLTGELVTAAGFRDATGAEPMPRT